MYLIGNLTKETLVLLIQENAKFHLIISEANIWSTPSIQRSCLYTVYTACNHNYSSICMNHFHLMHDLRVLSTALSSANPYFYYTVYWTWALSWLELFLFIRENWDSFCFAGWPKATSSRCPQQATAGNGTCWDWLRRVLEDGGGQGCWSPVSGPWLQQTGYLDVPFNTTQSVIGWVWLDGWCRWGHPPPPVAKRPTFSSVTTNLPREVRHNWRQETRKQDYFKQPGKVGGGWE